MWPVRLCDVFHRSLRHTHPHFCRNGEAACYGLGLDGELVYVGQSIQPWIRFEDHACGKEFDSIFTFEFEDVDGARVWESVLIDLCWPKYNKQEGRGHIFRDEIDPLWRQIRKAFAGTDAIKMIEECIAVLNGPPSEKLVDSSRLKYAPFLDAALSPSLPTPTPEVSR